MSGYLLDTDIAGELRKKQRANADVVAWFESIDEDDVFLSVLILGEIRKGIEQVRSSDPPQAQALEKWLNGLERMYVDRLLPVTVDVADRWGRLSAIRPISTIDGLLAATALVHDLTFVTRNAPDVGHTGVKLLNPFE